MSRYIEYEPLMAELEREVELADDWKTAHEIANVAKYAPSIDIVRCKECKWCLVEEGGCERIGMVLFADEIENHFCGYGERKESE